MRQNDKNQSASLLNFSGVLQLLIVAAILICNPVHAKRVEIKDDAAPLPQDVSDKTGPTGRKEATKYFTSNRAPSSAGSRDHYMGLHIGGFISSESYVWGRSDKSEDNGKLTMGVTYRLGEWANAADWLIRGDFISYSVDESKPLKLSVIFAAVFPDANSRFPLYFGAGLGPGIFFKQAKKESPLSLDYQLYGGVRFFDVFEGVGFFGEAGLKNHMHLLSDGQFNSVFFAIGTLFTF